MRSRGDFERITCRRSTQKLTLVKRSRISVHKYWQKSRVDTGNWTFAQNMSLRMRITSAIWKSILRAKIFVSPEIPKPLAGGTQKIDQKSISPFHNCLTAFLGDSSLRHCKSLHCIINRQLIVCELSKLNWGALFIVVTMWYGESTVRKPADETLLVLRQSNVINKNHICKKLKVMIGMTTMGSRDQKPVASGLSPNWSGSSC